MKINEVLSAIKTWVENNFMTLESWRGFSRSVSQNASPQTPLVTIREVGDALDQFGMDYIAPITGKISSEATSSNQLLAESEINAKIATASATFRGTNTTATTEAAFRTWANAIVEKDDNDYVFWRTTDTDGNVIYKRFKYGKESSTATENSWIYEYDLNNTAFTNAQWSAINSGITTDKVAKIKNASAGEAGFVKPSDGLVMSGTDGTTKVQGASGIMVNSQGVSVKAGNGLGVDTSNNIIVRAASGGGITVDSNGVSAALKSVGNGISGTNGVVAVKPAPNGHITANASGVSVDVQSLAVEEMGITYEFSNNDGFGVKTDVEAGTTITEDGNVGVALAPEGGLIHTEDGIEATVKGADQGVYMNGGIVQVKAGKGIIASVVGGVEVKAASGGGITVDANGVSAALKSVGNGISGTNGVVAAKAHNGITVDSNGISVKAASGGGITVDATGVSAALKATGNGITNSSGTIAAKAYNGITVDSNGIGVKGASGITVNSSGVSVNAGDGLSIDNSNKVVVKEGTGIDVDGDGVHVKTKASLGTTIDQDTNTVKVALASGGGLSFITDGIKANILGAADQTEINAGETASKAITPSNLRYVLLRVTGQSINVDQTTGRLVVNTGAGLSVSGNAVVASIQGSASESEITAKTSTSKAITPANFEYAAQNLALISEEDFNAIFYPQAPQA